MKQLFSLALAGMFGGLVTLGGVYLLNDRQVVSGVLPATYAVPVNQVNISPRPLPVGADFREAAARAMPAVVHISARAEETAKDRGNQRREEELNPFRFFFDEDSPLNPFGGGGAPQEGTGSGVVYSSDGYIITNNHVVEFADKIEVTLYDNRTFEAKVVGTYEKADLAVIKIEADDLAPLEFGDSDAAQVGEWVLAVGNPFDLTSTVTAGIISAKSRSIQLLGGNDAIEAFIQTDAAVNPGNSGGALVDAQGRLLGINTAIATRTGVFSGYSFAIPVNLMRRIADDIIRYGSFQRAFLGVTISELDSEVARDLGVSISRGVVIDELTDGGSAQYSGLLPKDVIVRVNGHDISGVPELQEIVGKAKVGDVLNVTVNRRGKVLEIPVQLKAG